MGGQQTQVLGNYVFIKRELFEIGEINKWIFLLLKELTELTLFFMSCVKSFMSFNVTYTVLLPLHLKHPDYAMLRS